MTRIMLIHPGASFSTHDVYVGYRDALTRAGVEVVEYLLDERLEVANRYLKALFSHATRHLPRNERRTPTSAEVMWQACSDMIPRALWHKVDFVLHFSAMYLHPDFLVMLRRAGIPNVALLTESPYADLHHLRLLPYIDAAFTNERTSVARLRAVNSDVYYLPCAHDPATHRPGPVPDGVPAHDVVLVGTGFQERIDLLAGVDWSGIDLGLYGTWSLLGSRHPLRRYVRGGVMSNTDAVDRYRAAKIGLNLYRTSMGYGSDTPHVEAAESLNPRAVELAACGVFTLSDYRAEVRDVFGHDVPTFAGSANLEHGIRYWLRVETTRERMAARLPGKVAHMTFDANVQTMAITLRKIWGARDRAVAAD